MPYDMPDCVLLNWSNKAFGCLFLSEILRFRLVPSALQCLIAAFPMFSFLVKSRAFGCVLPGGSNAQLICGCDMPVASPIFFRQGRSRYLHYRLYLL